MNKFNNRITVIISNKIFLLISKIKFELNNLLNNNNISKNQLRMY